MWKIAININEGAVALYQDDNLKFFVQEERLTKCKYDDSPYLGLEMIADYLKDNELSSEIPELTILGGREYHEILPSRKISKFLKNSIEKVVVEQGAYPIVGWTGEVTYVSLLRKKFLAKIMITDSFIDCRLHQHLITGLTGLINSSYNNSTLIVIESTGSGYDNDRYSKFLSDHHDVPTDALINDTWEVESIWSFNKDLNRLQKFYSNYGSNILFPSGNIIDQTNTISEISPNNGIIKSFEAVNTFLNFHHNDITKTMFLAAYGKENSRIIVSNDLANNDKLIKTKFPKPSSIIEDYDIELFKNINDHSWHDDPNLIDDYKKDLAYAVQESAFSRVCQIVDKALEFTHDTNLIIIGKINYNYRINYRLLKKFPNIKFYHDPISHCGGNVLGTMYSQNMKPLENLYIGPNIINYYSNESFDGFEMVETTAIDVAQLIINGNIVALFQGRSEAGANALGNRSILFDPTLIDGRKTLAKLKNKKWFESYSASCLLEYAHDWFDMAGLKESPYMMYAVDVLEDKKVLIPSVVHYDGSCVLQTVTENQNSNLYNLLKEFNKIKNVPILLNTGFHLENSPLVETLDDAIFTMKKIDITYLWLPDINKLAIKNNN
jgi:carbamoyltransferase